ncbi:AAA family ATPase [Hamadaea tsunoensis]|uniref:AAA family ATPase n=1 Tax=Hamadaea tsunoensis TaxID=53368 RepID=UPI0004153151|nr:DUF3696 domain-containing protein [Hamadaea tsunoensis]
MLTALSFAHYRCFRDRQRLDIRPVTVVLGKNNSGKSAFTRAAIVLQTGFPAGGAEAPRAPLDLDRLGGESVAAFADLVHGHDPAGGIHIGLAFSDNRLRAVEARIDNIDAERRQVVSQVTATLGHGVWQLARTTDDLYEQMWTANDGRRRVVTGPVEFHGLLPRYLPREILPRDDEFELAAHSATAFGRIRYLSPFRDTVRREHAVPTGEPDGVGDRGQNLAAVLAHDQVRGAGRMRRRVNEMLREVLPDWTLDEVPDGRQFATVLRSNSEPGLAINIADAGSGVMQILPMLVQQAWDELAGHRDPTLYIVEEPELHLHPAAHAQLADLYLKAAKLTGNRFLIETHSEALLLRLRRRVAEEACSPDDVGIYFVHHDGRAATAQHITVDALGQLSSWPEGIFTEDFEEVRALAAAQMRKAGLSVA